MERYEPQYDRLVIIANPKSRRRGHKKAAKLYQRVKPRLNEELRGQLYTLLTEAPKHATEYAYQVCVEAKRPLVLSVSGDGGFHEVVNGVMQAKQETGNDPIVAIYKAGNANDHYRHVHGGTRSQFIESLLLGHTGPLDLMRVNLKDSCGSRHLYAHSYVGVGLTAAAGIELNAGDYNRATELAAVFRALRAYEPLPIEDENGRRLVWSLTCHNIPLMAKYLCVSPNCRADDGRFELLELTSREASLQKTRVALTALQGLMRGHFEGLQQCENYTFQVLESTQLQCDGEVYPLSAGTQVTVSCEQHAVDILSA